MTEQDIVFFYKNAINVFTDASCIGLEYTQRKKINATCPGFIATYKGRMITSGLEVYINEHSLFGETKAVDLAVNWCLFAASHGIYVPDGFYIFTDNLAVVQRVYNELVALYNAIENKKQPNIIRRTPQNLITWEDYITNIAFNIFTSGLIIRLFFTPSHVDVSKRPFTCTTQKEKFLKINEKQQGDLSNHVDNNIFHDMATYNNMVDMMTRNYLVINKSVIENDIQKLEITENKTFQPIKWPFTIVNYAQLSPQLLLSQTSN